MQEEIYGLNCTVTENNIHVEDSYIIKKRKKIDVFLKEVKQRHPECKVFEVRCWNNLISEWRTHNRLFAIGYKPAQTKSVDLDTYEPTWRKILYAILGI